MVSSYRIIAGYLVYLRWGPVATFAHLFGGRNLVQLRPAVYTSNLFVPRGSGLSHPLIGSHHAPARDRLGKSFHLAPLRNTQVMSSNTSLLPLGFRPPLAGGLGFCRQGSSLIHCSPVTNGFCLAIKSSFLHPTRHNTFRGASLNCI